MMDYESKMQYIKNYDLKNYDLIYKPNVIELKRKNQRMF